jgi:hypothetical protein
LVGLLIWNLSLQRQIAQTRRIQYMVVTDHQPTALKPMGTYGKSVAARVFHGPSGSDAVLVIENLPSPPPGKVYQVWVTNEQHQRPLHTLRGVHNVEQLLMQPDEPLSRYKWVMITVEDAAGSRFPSKTMVLAGDL